MDWSRKSNYHRGVNWRGKGLRVMFLIILVKNRYIILLFCFVIALYICMWLLEECIWVHLQCFACCMFMHVTFSISVYLQSAACCFMNSIGAMILNITDWMCTLYRMKKQSMMVCALHQLTLQLHLVEAWEEGMPSGGEGRGHCILVNKNYSQVNHNHHQKKSRANHNLFRSWHLFSQAPTIFSSVYTVGELRPHLVGNPLQLCEGKLLSKIYYYIYRTIHACMVMIR